MIRSFTVYNKGAVRLLVSGEQPERFINFCLTSGIALWGVKKRKDQLIVWIYASDFKNIRAAARKSKVRVKLLRRFGLPFLLKKLRRRKVLAMGAVFFVAAIYWLSGYVWFMEIQGLKSIPAGEVNQILEAEGLRVGARLEGIDEKAAEKRLMNDLPSVAWAGIRFQGTKVTVEIVEREGVFAEKTDSGDLVAGKDGVITECIVLSGEKAVDIGAQVKEGDVLIRSVPAGEAGPAGAEGIVKAKVRYESLGEAPLKQFLYERTGESDFAVKLFLNDWCISVKDAETSGFNAYEIEHKVKKTDGWRNSNFTVELNIDIYHELNVTVQEYSVDEAKRIAAVNAQAAAAEFVPRDAYVISREILSRESGDPNVVKAAALIETEEDIGRHIKYNRE